MERCIIHLVLIALLEPLAWAGYTDFLGGKDIQVVQENVGSTKSSAKVFPGGHDEKYWAVDSHGTHYKLRVRDELPEYAEIGVSMILDQVGLPNLPVYPILLEREKQGVPSTEEAKKLNGLFGRSGNGKEPFPATLQPAVHLKPFSLDQLDEKQLAELLGHLVVNAVVGNHDLGLIPINENLGFDGKHFYTLDSTQSFRFYPHENDNIGDILRRNFSSLLPSFINQVQAKDPKIVAKILNTYLTRLESLTNEDTSTLDFYFQGVNDLKKSKGQEGFDYRNKLRNRLHEIRASVFQFLKGAGLKEADLNELAVPDPKVSKIHLTLPQPPKDFRNSKPEDFLWTYYFQRSHQYRSNAIKEWAKELNIPEIKIIPHLIHQTDPMLFPKDFKLEERFPNYFSQSSHSPEEMKQAIVRALGSILARLDLPFEKDGKIQKTGFIPELLFSVKELDPNAKVYFSGGVVRSLLGYLYQQLYREMEKHPHEGAFEILNRITEKNLTLKKTKPLERIKVLGIGSDLDVLIDPSPHLSPSTLESLKSRALTHINSVRKNLTLEGNKTELITSLVPYGDVNLYADQINRSAGNGGSTMDFLALDLESMHIREPKNLPIDGSILSNFVKGVYDFIPIRSGEDADDKAIRALRTLLEIPFLKLTPSGEKALTDQLKRMLDHLQHGKPLSNPAMKQIEKLARNARFGGAYNRIFVSSDPVESLARDLILQLGRDAKDLPLLPRYIRNANPNKRTYRDLPPGLLMDPEDFKKKYTSDGYLYHGTPNIANLLNMIRNGMVISGLGQGAAAAGSGSYSSKNYSTAAGYSSEKGIVIPLQIKEGIHPRILDLSVAENQTKIQPIVKKAESLKKDPFQYLAEEYGVDIIVSSHVLIENSAVLRLPKNFGDLIRIQSLLLSKTFQNQTPDLEADLFQSAIGEYQSIYNLGKSLNYSDIPSLKEVLEELFRDPKINPFASSPSPAIKKVKNDWISSCLSPQVSVACRRVAAATLITLPDTEEKLKLLSIAAEDPDQVVRGLAVMAIPSCGSKATVKLFKKFLTDPDEDVAKGAAAKFPSCQGEYAEEILYTLFKRRWRRGNFERTISKNILNNPYLPLGKLLSQFIALSDPHVPEQAAVIATHYSGPERHSLLKKALFSPLNQTLRWNDVTEEYQKNMICWNARGLPYSSLEEGDFEMISLSFQLDPTCWGVTSLDYYLLKFPQPPRVDVDSMLEKMMSLEDSDPHHRHYFTQFFEILSGNYLSAIEDKLIVAAFSKIKNFKPQKEYDSSWLDGSTQSLTGILKSLLSKTEQHRLMAARALHAYPGEDLPDLFAQTLSDPSPTVWKAAQNSLTLLSKERQKAVIQSLLHNCNPLVQERARLAVQTPPLGPEVETLLNQINAVSKPSLDRQCRPQ